MKKVLFTLSRKHIFTLLFLTIGILGCSEDESTPSEGTESEDPIEDPQAGASTTITVDFMSVYGGSEDDTFHDVTATSDLSLIHI